MKLRSIIIILSVLMCGFLYLIREDIFRVYRLRNCIIWNENIEVKTSDYEMYPNLKSTKNISFWHGIDLSSNNFGHAKAYAIFDKSKSWIKDTSSFDYKNELKFQKLLFDLTEVYTRKINNKIGTLKYANYGHGIDFIILEEQFKNNIRNYNIKRSEILNKNGKSVSETVTYWRPVVDEMLKNEQ